MTTGSLEESTNQPTSIMFTEMANILITFTCVYEINNIQLGLEKTGT